jgi:hypothetical protein
VSVDKWNDLEVALTAKEAEVIVDIIDEFYLAGKKDWSTAHGRWNRAPGYASDSMYRVAAFNNSKREVKRVSKRAS